MKTYFYLDHARKACVMPCPNLITKVFKIGRFLGKKILLWSVVLLRSTLPAGGFFCQDFAKKA